MPLNMAGQDVALLHAHRRAVVMSAPWDRHDAAKDARSEARYEDDPQAEVDSVWRETLPEKGCAA